jgi:hypothetical protein
LTLSTPFVFFIEAHWIKRSKLIFTWRMMFLRGENHQLPICRGGLFFSIGRAMAKLQPAWSLAVRWRLSGRSERIS